MRIQLDMWKAFQAILMTDLLWIAHLRTDHEIANPEGGNPEIQRWYKMTPAMLACLPHNNPINSIVNSQ